MNYRHAFHAGNHGDVLKHVVLSRVLTYLLLKDAPLGLLDAHAGIGRYDLEGLEALKTGEWRGGIGAMLRASPPDDVKALLQPYFDCVRALNSDGALRHYPGSPEILTQFLRPQDRLILNELHPEDFETLTVRYDGLANVSTRSVDAAQAVKAVLPFAQRRGLVLVDPPFEVSSETTKVKQLLQHGLRRMAHACILIWYPVTTHDFADTFCDALSFEGAKSVLKAELLVRPAAENGGLAGSGVLIVNPPWVLHDELQMLLPFLKATLEEEQGGHATLRWIIDPT